MMHKGVLKRINVCCNFIETIKYHTKFDYTTFQNHCENRNKNCNCINQ